MYEFLEQRAIGCPYCGESFTIEVDRSAGDQSYIEDCQVCCRPVSIDVRIEHESAIAEITIRREDE